MPVFRRTTGKRALLTVDFQLIAHPLKCPRRLPEVSARHSRESWADTP